MTEALAPMREGANSLRKRDIKEKKIETSRDTRLSNTNSRKWVQGSRLWGKY